MTAAEYARTCYARFGRPGHLIALERVGPTHTPATFVQAGFGAEMLADYCENVPPEYRGRCLTMRARDISALTRPAHLLFEAPGRPETIGIGDGGNEIGMGRIAWDVIRRNIPSGALTACRVATDRLIVCGVSNWGAYALTAGVRHLLGAGIESFCDVGRERELLGVMVEAGPLVDGVLGIPSVSVDGLAFGKYAKVLERMRELMGPAESRSH
jgi:hypothetical protein